MAYPTSPTNGQIYGKKIWQDNRWRDRKELQLPDDTNLVLDLPFDEVPVVPDGANTQSITNFTALPGWNQNVPPVSNTFSNGIWTMTTNAWGAGYYRGGPASGYFILRFKVKQGRFSIGREGGAQYNYDVSSADQYCYVPFNGVNAIVIYGATESVSVIDIYGLYLGADGSYTSKAINAIDGLGFENTYSLPGSTIYGKSIILDGISRLRASTNLLNRTGNDSISISFFASIRNLNSIGRFICNAATANNWILRHDHGSLQWFDGSNYIGLGYTASTTNWAHYALTISNQQFKFYVNGSQVNSGTTGFGPAGGGVSIGSGWGLDQSISGDMSCIKIWTNRVLTTSEIEALSLQRKNNLYVLN